MTPAQQPLFEADAGADFSPCTKYRYRLWRRWAEGPAALWIMLNPSTADDCNDDPTVRLVCRRSQALGFAGVEICNLFALRSSDPSALYSHADPVGPENDEFLRAALEQVDSTICAWGRHGALYDRGSTVERLVAEANTTALALGVTKGGLPRHPLYLPLELGAAPLHDLRSAASHPSSYPC